MSDKYKGLQTIDCTPTWSGILPALLIVLEDGTEEGKKLARIELKRMAEIADKYVEHQKSINHEPVDQS
jgi:hypothetical protein